MESKILNELVSFIREETGEFKMDISVSTQIEDDLGVTGGEGVELIIKFAKRFNVDITSFEFDQYFHPEPNLFNTRRTIKPLTIGQLESAIEHKRLV